MRTQAFWLGAAPQHVPKADCLPGALWQMLSAGGPLLCVPPEYFHIYLWHYSTFMVSEIFILHKLAPHRPVAGGRQFYQNKQAGRQPPQKLVRLLNCRELSSRELLSEAYPDPVSKMPRADQRINKIQGVWLLEGPDPSAPPPWGEYSLRFVKSARTSCTEKHERSYTAD